MSFVQTLAYVGVTAVVGFATLVLTTIVRSKIALWKFQRKTPNMPMLENPSLLGNHVTSIYLRKHGPAMLKQWHAKYGKTFGWIFGTRPAVSSIDLDLIKTMVQDEPQAHINRMSFNSTRGEFEYNNIFTAESDQWRRIRRAFAPAFKPVRYLNPNVGAEVQGSIDKLLDAIENKLSKASAEGKRDIEMNADDMVHRYQMNLIFSCLYKQDNLIDFNAEHDHWVETIEGSLGKVITNPIVPFSMIFPVFRPVLDYFFLNFHRNGKWRRDLMNFVKIQTKTAFEARKHLEELRRKAKSRGEDLKDFDETNFTLKDGTRYRRNMMDYVIDQFMDGKLSKDEFFNSSHFLFAASDKTAADAITNTMLQLAKHPDIQEKCRQSILAEGTESKYLGMCLDESMRFFPPVAVGCSRTVSRDVELADGKIVPAGTYVLTPVYVIHRSKEYWGDDVDEFKPERFLDTSKFHPMQYIPFGAGIRNCPGKDFALYEMKLLFSQLLTRYKFEMARPKDDVDVFDSPLMIYTLPNTPAYLRVTRVNPSAA